MGISSASIEEKIALLGLEFPMEVYELYEWHDGVNIDIKDYGIIASIYCLYYQVVFVIFNNLSRSSKREYSNVFLSEMLPQLLIIVISLIFLVLNVKDLILSIKGK